MFATPGTFPYNIHKYIIIRCQTLGLNHFGHFDYYVQCFYFVVHTVLARSLVKPDIMQELFDKKSGQQRCITAAQLSNPLENLLQIVAIKQVFQIVQILLHLLDVQ